MTQYARPSADESTPWSGWTGSYTAIDEVTPSDGDYLTGAEDSNGTAYVSLGSVDDPSSSIDHILRYRVWQENESNDRTCTVKLMQGATEITSDAIDLSTFKGTATQFNHTLTSGEADTITDYSDLHLEIVGGGNTSPPGKNQSFLYFSWAVLEVPDAGTPPLVVSPTAISSVGAVVAPTVVQTSQTITPTPVAGVAGKVDPTVVQTSQTIATTPVSAVGTVVDPTVIKGTLTIVPAVVSAVAGVVAPTVIRGSIAITPTQVAAIGAVVDPTVQEGAAPPLEITPGVVTAVAGVVNPTVVRGSITIDPTEVSAVGGVNGPDVVKGSVAITPGAVSGIAGVVAPTVIKGTVVISPSPVDGVAGKVDPVVIKGTITITPETATSVGVTVDPTVVAGEEEEPVTWTEVVRGQHPYHTEM